MKLSFDGIFKLKCSRFLTSELKIQGTLLLSIHFTNA